MNADNYGDVRLPIHVVNNKESLTYPGRELEAMDQAANYHRWILEIFKPFLGSNIVEVGAGMGSFSELILRGHKCETLSLVEPSKEMYEQLVARVQELQLTTINTYHATFETAAPLIKSQHLPDSIIYVNVLEHVADDEHELDAVHETLSDNGRAFIFVPALSWLYGSFDERIGHVRRYSKRELEGKLERAGFKVVFSTYFDFFGVVPWWVKYRVLKSSSMNPRAVRLYDRFIVPAARRLENIVPPPIGKNLVVIAEKR
jgi:SAM-dependent methyltransferase